MANDRFPHVRLYRLLFPLALLALALLGSQITLASAPAAPAPRASLSAGDIAIVGMNSDNPDVFAFVLLTSVDAGTEISFTDNGWLASGGFRGGEGVDTWTAPTTLCAGTVVTPEVGGMLLSTSGDQILAFQGVEASPTMLYGLNNEGSAWQADATSSNTSALPDGLVDGATAVAVTETDNIIYTGPVSGTVAALQAAIGNPANWSGDDATPQLMPTGPFTVTDAAPCSGPGQVLINEVDADTAGTDAAEFVELYDGGVGNTALDGLAVVFFNGSSDTSYAAFDLDGFTTDADGYFFLGNGGLGPDISFPDDTLQNGADAVALYQADATDFPNGTPATTTGLVDALVYDTDDGDDGGLLILLNPGEPQVNERAGGSGTEDSNQRCPNGLGGLRNTSAYTQDVPTPGAANFCGGGGGGSPLVCGDPATLIHDVQGGGAASPLPGATVEIEGVVVGDFQDTGSELSGFYLQEEDGDADADPATSEGVFVFDGGFGVDVAVGDVVRVAGTVDEFFDLTQVDTVTGVMVCSSGAAVTPATITLPVSDVMDLEAYEGMAVVMTQTLYVTDNFNTGRFGEVTLSVDGRLFQGTHLFEPGAPALAQVDLNRRSQIQLDDGSTIQNPLPLPPYLGPDDTLRAGDTTDGLSGVLSYGFGVYEIHPTQVVSFTRVNERAATPTAISGTLRVATFNVLNFFTTIDTGDPICGPSGDLDCRGADSADEFNRQRDKIIAALAELDADVIGINEIENNETAALQSLVDGLNAVVGAGTYNYVNTGFIGTDAIKVGFLYDTTTVSLAGDFAILDSSVDPIFLDTKNRPALAQTFQEIATGERFTAVVNHLKSKGSSCSDVGDPDQGDGQGNCAGVRTDAATALVNWLETDPTASGDADFMILGDLNSYAKEDPIDALTAGGYTDLLAATFGADAYSYVFFGEAGYLDYIMTNDTLSAQVAGVTVWHINADEPRALDYNDFNQPLLYNDDPYRASDHDPIVVGLDLVPPYRIWLPAILSNN